MTNFDFDFDLGGFEEDLKNTLADGQKAFKGQYKDEINALMGLSREEVDALVPGTEDLAVYAALISVVKDASAKNLAQAELKNRIAQLGEMAISISKRVPSLAAMFA